MFFDSSKVKPTAAFTPLEPGIYRMLVENTESKTSQAGAPYQSMTLTCLDEPHKGRKVWHNFFLSHEKENVRAISESQMKDFLEAIGNPAGLQYENDFHREAANKILMISIGTRLNKQTGEQQNNVRSFLPKGAPKAASTPATRSKNGGTTAPQAQQQQPANWTQDPSLSEIPF